MNSVKNNIYISGEYLQKNPGWGKEDALWKAIEIAKLMRKNNFFPRSLTDVGCGTGEIINFLAKLLPSLQSLKGYDISPQAIALAKKSENERIRFYLGDFFTTGLKDECILLIDVLEHVQDYIGFLRELHSKAGHFVFHIPLDLSCRTIFKPHVILQQRSDVGHLHYFTREHVNWLLDDCGYKVIDWKYTLSETDRNSAASPKQWIKKWLRRFSYAISKETSVRLWGGYSIMLLCSAYE